MALYYVDTDLGCRIIAAKNIQQARRTAMREVGTDHYRSCNKATAEQIDWVASMGGRIPKEVA